MRKILLSWVLLSCGLFQACEANTDGPAGFTSGNNVGNANISQSGPGTLVMTELTQESDGSYTFRLPILDTAGTLRDTRHLGFTFWGEDIWPLPAEAPSTTTCDPWREVCDFSRTDGIKGAKFQFWPREHGRYRWLVLASSGPATYFGNIGLETSAPPSPPPTIQIGLLVSSAVSWGTEPELTLVARSDLDAPSPADLFELEQGRLRLDRLEDFELAVVDGDSGKTIASVTHTFQADHRYLVHLDEEAGIASAEVIDLQRASEDVRGGLETARVHVIHRARCLGKVAVRLPGLAEPLVTLDRGGSEDIELTRDMLSYGHFSMLLDTDRDGLADLVDLQPIELVGGASSGLRAEAIVLECPRVAPAHRPGVIGVLDGSGERPFEAATHHAAWRSVSASEPPFTPDATVQLTPRDISQFGHAMRVWEASVSTPCNVQDMALLWLGNHGLPQYATSYTLAVEHGERRVYFESRYPEIHGWYADNQRGAWPTGGAFEAFSGVDGTGTWRFIGPQGAAVDTRVEMIFSCK